MKAFDRKFGPEFLASIPTVPGVYRVFGEDGGLIYVGKAKNLRRRLSQYRNVKRRKKHLKMRSIVSDAARIEYETCASDLDACLLETRIIQSSRPRWNVAGAFFFLYPMIGVRHSGGILQLCFTTEPANHPEFEFHGAFRSREISGAAFFSLVRLLAFIGHREKKTQAKTGHSYVFSFRQLPESWAGKFGLFLSGQSQAFMEELVLGLIENAGARRAGKEIQDQLNDLKRFWRHEALPLAKARSKVGTSIYPVPQLERDHLFLKFRMTT